MNIQYIDIELSKKNIDHEKFIVGQSIYRLVKQFFFLPLGKYF